MQEENKGGICNIYIVRHGQTEWNEKKITQGQSESLISKIGTRQAKKIGERLRNIKFSAIYSSDLSMAHRTAEIIRHNRKLTVRTSKLLRGRSYGSFEGKHVDVYKNVLKNKIKEREILPENEYASFRLAPFIETDEELVTRFIKKLKEIAARHLNGNVLIVTHGGNIKNLLIKIGNMERKLLSEGSFKHGGYMKLLSDGKSFSIKEAEGLKK